MKSVLCLLLIVAYVIGDPEVCTGLKALHQKSGCCGGTGDATCVAAPAKHYLGTRETKHNLHEVGHLVVALAENVTITKIQYRCPADDTVTYNDQVVTWEHNETYYRAYGKSGSWVQATSVNITTVYNAKTDTLCETTPEDGGNRRSLSLDDDGFCHHCLHPVHFTQESTRMHELEERLTETQNTWYRLTHGNP